MENIFVKRIYEKPSPEDGYRVLVDRLWPRGISKEEAQLDEWDKDLAPSTALRKWFNHEPEKFAEFEIKYKDELKNQTEGLKKLLANAKTQKLCLLFGAKDERYNQAIVLKSVLNSLSE